MLQTTSTGARIVVAEPQEGEHRVGAIVADDPAKARGLAVALDAAPARRAIEPVEIAHQPLHAGMRGIVEQVPVELARRDSIRAPARTRRP